MDMLTDPEIKVIIMKDHLTQEECLGVIRRYIYDLKNIDVKNIYIQSMISLNLMDIAYSKSVHYYVKKLINDI